MGVQFTFARGLFADTFTVLSLKDKYPEGDAHCVQIATVQSMIKRVLFEPDLKPSVGQYDCIVVDECHRGYLLDQVMDDAELAFRDQNDYLSKYRQVLHYFDAFRIGLTATPAAHTAAIFGKPVFTYSYPEAVIDGYLVDHLPPIRIQTKLAKDGIHYAVNEEVQVYDAVKEQVVSYHTPDELTFEVAQFNRSIITENFNRAVIEHIISNALIDPEQPAKTLVFCVNDVHADLVVSLFKAVCQKHLGAIEDDAIQKITGSIYKPLDAILKFKNDRLPNIAVTVDLLTTGIDVDTISNLIFLRQVNSRILYEQMLGRATRLCPTINKGHFRIFDAVDLYSKLQTVNTMRPVVTDPTISFVQLEMEMAHAQQTAILALARGQFLAKLQIKKHYLTTTQTEAFIELTQHSPKNLIPKLKAMTHAELAAWLQAHQGIGDILDAKLGNTRPPIIISGHVDEVVNVTEGYGDGRQRPEAYLEAFRQFINSQGNKLPALEIVVTRPWSLTRVDLKKLLVELEKHQFRELDLDKAWQATKNEDIVARIIGHIRQAALGEALIPWAQRVNKTTQKILAQQDWNAGQRKWIQAIAGQTQAEIVVDQDSFNSPIFKNQGGLKKANILFDNNPLGILQQFNQALWQEVG
jgi:type I restriction enzyme R subunit